MVELIEVLVGVGMFGLLILAVFTNEEPEEKSWVTGHMAPLASDVAKRKDVEGRPNADRVIREALMKRDRLITDEDGEREA